MSIAIGFSAMIAHGQNIVDVNDGEILTEMDLLAGEFNGQKFALGEDLIINLNEGGILAQVGSDLPSPDPFVAFDFLGTTINVNDGGRIQSTIFVNSYISNAVINLHLGGTTGSDILTNTAVTLNILGGSLGAFSNIQEGTTVNLKLGSFNTFQIGPFVEFNMAGGVASQGFAGGFNIFKVKGGCVQPSTLNAGSQLDLFVREILVNGVSVELVDGETVSIVPTPDLLIEAILANGQPYLFDALGGRDDLSTAVTITATHMITCGTDLNFDDQLDFFDISLYLRAFMSTPPAGEFDCHIAGGSYNDFFDVSAFLEAFLMGCE